MGRPYFQFKQFTVWHDQCGMKVSTDACLFGAYVAHKLTQQSTPPSTILDIGAGTGLLTLMLAQALPQSARLTAVEYDNDAYQQCRKNLHSSRWKERTSAYHSDIKEFATLPAQGYELIITNPPFFPNSLQSPKQARNQARHQGSLSLEELAQHSIRLLNPRGELWVLLPIAQQNNLELILDKYNYKPICKCFISHNSSKSPIRSIYCYAAAERATATAHTEHIPIKRVQQEQAYTAEYIELLKPYYLIF